MNETAAEVSEELARAAALRREADLTQQADPGRASILRAAADDLDPPAPVIVGDPLNDSHDAPEGEPMPADLAAAILRDAAATVYEDRQ